jgi:hypothetical protein
MAKGILIMLLLIVGAGAGGYFFGTFQKFAPIEYVPLGTPGAQSGSAAAVGGGGSGPSTALKKKYWLYSYGSDHVGYNITVSINGQKAAQFNTDGREVDVTRFVKQGENQINFDAAVLPEGMREHAGNSSYYLQVHLYSGNVVGQNSGRDEILKYSRNAAEFDPHNDTMSFITLE